MAVAKIFSCAADLHFHPPCSAWFLEVWVKDYLIYICCHCGQCGGLAHIQRCLDGISDQYKSLQTARAQGERDGLLQHRRLRASSWSWAQGGAVWPNSLGSTEL